MAALPKEVMYNKPMASLPADTQCLNVIVRPSNNQTANAGGDIIQFDLPSHSFLVPSSMTLRGVINHKPSAADKTDHIFGVPGASWIQRLETIVGGNLIESINGYNKLYNMVGMTKLSVDEKISLATELCIGGSDTVKDTAIKTDDAMGRTLLKAGTAVETYPFAIPLGCLLASCGELVPLGLMGGVRIQLTTAAISSFLEFETATPLTFNVTNMELNFDLVSFGAAMDGVVASMADSEGNLILKSQGWNINDIATNTSANSAQDLIFNTRLSSIKSLVYQGSPGFYTNDDGKIPDMVAPQVQGPAGTTQFFVASTPYPPTPLREANTAAVKSELRQAFGEIHDVYSTKASIQPDTWNGPNTLLGATMNLILPSAPPSHFVGVNTEKLSTNAVMLSGVSSQLSPINVRLIPSVASHASFTSTLYACYDAIVAINVPTRTIAVRV
jgi:hypothetical protein